MVLEASAPNRIQQRTAVLLSFSGGYLDRHLPGPPLRGKQGAGRVLSPACQPWTRTWRRASRLSMGPCFSHSAARPARMGSQPGPSSRATPARRAARTSPIHSRASRQRQAERTRAASDGQALQDGGWRDGGTANIRVLLPRFAPPERAPSTAVAATTDQLVHPAAILSPKGASYDPKPRPRSRHAARKLGHPRARPSPEGQVSTGV